MNWYLWYLEVLRNYHMIHQTFGDSLNQGARQASCGGSLSGDTKHMHKTPWKGKLSKPNVFGAPPILRCPQVRPDGISIWWNCWIMSTIPNSRRRVPGRFFSNKPHFPYLEADQTSWKFAHLSIFPSAWFARPSPFSVTAVSRWVSWKAWEVSRSESCKGWDSQTADATKIHISPKVTETLNFLHVDFSIPKLIRNLACFSCQVVDQSSVLGITQYMCGTLPDWVGAMVSHIFTERDWKECLSQIHTFLALEDIS